MYTLNQVVTAIKGIGKYQGQIKTVHYGYLEDLLAKKDLLYPIMLFKIISSPISAKEANFPVQFLFIDRIDKDDQDQELDVQSDMLQVSDDVVAMLNDNRFDWTVSGNISRDLGTQASTPDVTAGVVMDLTISQPFRYDRCKIPTTETSIFTNEFTDQLK